MIDYSITKRIIKDCFKTTFTDMKSLEKYCPVDCAYTATTKTNEYHYLIEIKSVSSKNYDACMKYGQIFKLRKFNDAVNFANMRENNEKVLFVFLYEKTKEYYIFDASKVDWDKTKLFKMTMKQVNYNPNSKPVEEISFDFKLQDAVAHGTYQLNEIERGMIALKNTMLQDQMKPSESLS